MCWDMIGFSIYISCYNFPIIIAYFNCILKIYSSDDITWIPWRNWLARSAVDREVGGSSPTGSGFLSTQHIHLHTFLHDHYFGSYGCLITIDRRKTNYKKNQWRTQYILPFNIWQSQGKQFTCWNFPYPGYNDMHPRWESNPQPVD